MPKNPVLDAALRAPTKQPLLQHRNAISVLRQKGYAWREIAAFLAEQGIEADHTTLFRLFKGAEKMSEIITVPDATAYSTALISIGITDKEKMMLLAHYRSHNRAMTYTSLAKAAGYSDNGPANSQYGKLGHRLGDALGFNFEKFKGSDVNWYSSSIGMQMPEPFASGEIQLVMHHELAKAIEQLKWA